MRTIFFVLCVVAISTVSCAGKPKRNAAEAEWVSRMHELSAVHLNLTPVMNGRGGMGDPRHKAAVSADLKRFAELAVEVSHDPKAPNADPLIEFSGNNFAADARQAYAAFKAEDPGWARFAFKRAGHHCVACHTRADRGAKDFKLAWQPELSSLSPVERIDFLLSNRQYSKAMSEAEKLAANEKIASADSLAWLEALERVMTMVIRVNGDREFAGRLTKLAQQNPGVPFYIRMDLREWQKDIQEWPAQAKGSDREKLRVVHRLLEKNQQLAFRGTHGAYVSNLRASALLHRLLENSSSPLYVEALQASGLASESLGEPELGQYYYEACIRQMPHSLPAERCFARLAASIRQNNPFLESETDEHYNVRMTLERLREMAESTQDPKRTRFEKSE